MNSITFSPEKIFIELASKLGSWYREKFVEKAKIKVKSKTSSRLKKSK